MIANSEIANLNTHRRMTISKTMMSAAELSNLEVELGEFRKSANKIMKSTCSVVKRSLKWA